MRSHIGWGGESSIFYKGVETSPWSTRFKNLEGKPRREGPKRTISANGGLGPLQMVTKPDTGRYASKEADMRRCASKDVGP